MNQDQVANCQKYGSACVVPNNDEIVGIALKTLDQNPLFGVRITPTEKTTGWYIHGGPYSDDPHFYQPVCLSHVMESCPIIIKYLALEPGFRFLADSAGYEDVWKEPATESDAAKL